MGDGGARSRSTPLPTCDPRLGTDSRQLTKKRTWPLMAGKRRNQPLNPNPRVKPREGQVRGADQPVTSSYVLW